VLAAIRTRNRLERMLETLRLALNQLSEAARSGCGGVGTAASGLSAMVRVPTPCTYPKRPANARPWPCTLEPTAPPSWTRSWATRRPDICGPGPLLRCCGAFGCHSMTAVPNPGWRRCAGAAKTRARRRRC
jgi:hypothetical protein